jgi:hypothetical protein
MTYSKAHQLFADYINDVSALTEPQDFLGPNYETLLNFWKYIDKLTEEQWRKVALARNDYHGDQVSVMKIATGVIGSRNRAAVWESTCNAVSSIHDVGAAASFAAREIICMHLLIENGIEIQFLPIFGNL